MHNWLHKDGFIPASSSLLPALHFLRGAGRTSGCSWLPGRSGTLPKSYVGSRWTCVKPAAANSSRWRTPAGHVWTRPCCLPLFSLHHRSLSFPGHIAQGCNTFHVTRSRLRHGDSAFGTITNHVTCKVKVTWSVLRKHQIPPARMRQHADVLGGGFKTCAACR